MRPTSSHTRPSDLRHRAAALLAGLAAVTMVVVAAPAAAAAAGPMTADRSASSVLSEEQPITLDDLRALVQQQAATGGLDPRHARRLQAFLSMTEVYLDYGITFRAIQSLESFKDYLDEPFFEPSEAAIEELTAAADQLIAQLRDTP